MTEFKLTRKNGERRGLEIRPDLESNAAIAARARDAARGMSFGVVADLVGADQESTRRYLQGISRMPAAFAAGLCRATGVSPAWLLLGAGEPRPGAPA